MAPYRIHFLDPAGRVIDAVQIQHATDEAAIEEAQRVDIPSIGAGFDIWLEQRLVHRHRRNTYRIYFRNRHGFIIGHDDFDAQDDDHAMAIARTLRNVCSDICTSFELWQSARRVDTSGSTHTPGSADEITARVQNTVLEREMALLDSEWVIADSSRLLKQTRRLVESRRST
jgi:hypothetical protein